MREKFELCSKVLGLAVFCYGVIYSLSMIPTYFHQPRADTLVPPSMLNTVAGQQFASYMNEAMPRLFAWITVQLFLQGIVPALLGLYLMRSNNLFVRLCYPNTPSPHIASTGSDIQLHTSSEASAQRKESKSDDRYAPPGYHS
jgi:hypothetical protein